MMDTTQWLALLQRATATAHAMAAGGVHMVVEHVAEEARDLVGRENREWAPLSSATMDGFRHPYGFWIRGKTELGYTGHVSSTDPLLRTGAGRDSIEAASLDLTGVVGSKSKVMLFQEMGTHNPLTGDIPPRPTMGLAMQKFARPTADLVFGEIGVALTSPMGRVRGPRP